MRALFVVLTFSFFASAAVPARPADAYAAARSTFGAARDLLLAHLDAAKINSDDAYDIVTRFATAIAALDDAPANDPASVEDETVHANLDLAWANAVTTGACQKPAPSGLSETCFRSTADGTLQPAAVYVPNAHDAAAPAVVVLRGRGQTESDLASYRELRALADRSRAVLILPYARGRATYDRAATQDVFDAIDAVASELPIDAKKTYVAGFSMGGFAAFHVAGAAPQRFAGLLSIVGGLSPADRDAIKAFDRPAYVVNAERDTLITPDHGRGSVSYLHEIGHSAIYYEQKGGVHSFCSVLPAVRDAWSDMFAGVTNRQPSETPANRPFSPPDGTATQRPTQGRPA